LRLGDRDDPDLFALMVDEAHFVGANQFVDAVFGFCGSAVESRSSSWRVNAELPPLG